MFVTLGALAFQGLIMLCSFLKAISESALFVLMIEQKQW
jgi:hypothetical protein